MPNPNPKPPIPPREDAYKRVLVSLNAKLLAEIDRVAGERKRSRWLEEAARQRLDREAT